MEQFIPPLSTVIVLAAVVIGVILFVRMANRDAARREARVKSALPADAKVVQVGRSQTLKNQGTVVVRLRLEIHRPEQSPYQATTAWEVGPAHIPKIQEGQSVAVKIDQDDPNIIYPRVSWAEYSWIYAPKSGGG